MARCYARPRPGGSGPLKHTYVLTRALAALAAPALESAAEASLTPGIPQEMCTPIPLDFALAWKRCTPGQPLPPMSMGA